MTRTLSTRLKLSANPLVYSYDTPGVMLPFLGRGDKGAERGVKLALIGECLYAVTWVQGQTLSWPAFCASCGISQPIAGIKEGLYDVEALASYLLYRFNLLDPVGTTV